MPDGITSDEQSLTQHDMFRFLTDDNKPNLQCCIDIYILHVFHIMTTTMHCHAPKYVDGLKAKQIFCESNNEKLAER